MDNINWLIKSFNELTATDVYQIFKLRQDVFIVEQACIYNDFDGKDNIATHVMGLVHDDLVAYTRVFNPDDYFSGHTAFGRVVTSASVRGSGVGRALVKTTLMYLNKTAKNIPCKISAQSHLEHFYNGFGFKKIGQAYLEDNIPHIAMVRADD